MYAHLLVFASYIQCSLLQSIVSLSKMHIRCIATVLSLLVFLLM